MRYGRKQVARFFVDRHIPLYLRETWPVVENAQGNIILVPGLGCDVVHFSIKPDFKPCEPVKGKFQLKKNAEYHQAIEILNNEKARLIKDISILNKKLKELEE